MTDLLDEVDGQLLKATIRYPELQKVIWKLHKHIKYALNNPGKVDEKDLLKQAKGWMTARMVELPELDFFRGTIGRL